MVQTVTNNFPPVFKRILVVTVSLGVLLAVSLVLGVSIGSSGFNFKELLAVIGGQSDPGELASAIIWQIRLPRVLLAAVVGSTLALGGLVFQALLRNPLAEPYILGISGGSAIGAILGMIAGFSMFPGVTLLAFMGSVISLALVLVLVSGRSLLSKDSLLLGGVMLNAFCSAGIMFLISMSRTSQAHHILFWLMGDLSLFSNEQLPILAAVVPSFLTVFVLARSMNVLLVGKEAAATMGINVQAVTITLLIVTTFMVSVVVCQSGLVGFVGLVIPHIFRTMLGPDHRLLVPACIFGGGSYLILCDLLARILPSEGEMPVGIITAMIGAPLFIFLLWRTRR